MSKKNYSPSRMTCYIALGSNLDDPIAHVLKAIEDLKKNPNLAIHTVSSLYKNKAIGKANQPDYINAVAKITTELSPKDLLNALQKIETAHGRKRHVRWEARTLDLDLLLYENKCIQTKSLTIPHPEIYNRRFVLIPLAEIDPQLIFPDGKYIQEALKNCPMHELERIEINS